jgi:hypothetical protein
MFRSVLYSYTGMVHGCSIAIGYWTCTHTHYHIDDLTTHAPAHAKTLCLIEIVAHSTATTDVIDAAGAAPALLYVVRNEVQNQSERTPSGL